MTTPRIRFLLLFAPFFMFACHPAANQAKHSLEEAAQRVLTGTSAPADQALAGFAAYLLRSKPEEAAPLFAQAAQAGNPWGVYGQMELARRSLDFRQRVLLGLRICGLAPRHALCAVAARMMLGTLGESPGLDATIGTEALNLVRSGQVMGDGAYFLRLAAVSARRNQGRQAEAQALLDEAGQVGIATLLGPYSRYHALEWDVAFPPEQGDATGGTPGPYGPVQPREVNTPDGLLALYGESTSADVYYWVTDFEVREAAAYQLRVIHKDTFRVLVDGQRVGERRNFEDWQPDEQIVQLKLGVGLHRLVIKTAGANHDGLGVALSRVDGQPARLIFKPAKGTFANRQVDVQTPTNAFADVAGLVKALEPEVGSVLAGLVAIRATQERDFLNAKSLAHQLVAQQASAALLALRGETELNDRSLPLLLAQGRAKRDLENAVALDPGEASVLQRLSISARNQSQYDEAARFLARAREVAFPGNWHLLLSEMRLAQARNADAVADDFARQAIAVEPGQCEALQVRYDLARRNDAASQADGLLKNLALCPGQDGRLAEHLKNRGNLAQAQAQYQKIALLTPLDPTALLNAAQMALAHGQAQEAVEMLKPVVRLWPYSSLIRKRRAEVLAQAGDKKAARAEREAALLIDGSDLRLRRALALEDGKELLDDLKTDAAPFLERYQQAAITPGSFGVYILDASAVEVHPNGAFTERTHVLAKVLDQRGIEQLAEVHLPNGAEVLTLRTIKPDGRVLEPEPVGDKDGISLPGVEVGDLIEYEYLAATSNRAASMPGFATPRFFFRIADGQLFHSRYTVRAPLGIGLQVDAHGLTQPKVEKTGAYELVVAQQNNVSTFVREPDGPNLEEVLPFVQVGAGAGAAELMAGIGDLLVGHARPTPQIVQFAKDAVQKRSGLAAVKSLYDKVMQTIKGPEESLSASAAATLEQGRGSRILLLKSALKAVGISSRVALARPFDVDQAPYRFPSAEHYHYALLVVRLASGEIFLNPGTRFAPFGRLAPSVEGQEAAILPEPGEQTRFLRTPKSAANDVRGVELKLTLREDGTLEGEGKEIYQGFEAASLRETLDRLDQPQRRQAFEEAVSRTFENSTLTNFTVTESDGGAPITLGYSFRAPGYARVGQGRLTIPHGLYQASLGRRFLSLFERQTPLLIASPEGFSMTARITLPRGMEMVGQPRNEKLDSVFGNYRHIEKKLAGAVEVRESMSLAMARVAPAQYRAFGDFVTAVDQDQAREMVIGPQKNR